MKGKVNGGGEEVKEAVTQRLVAVRSQIAEAAGRVGRKEEDIQLIAVSKGQSIGKMKAAFQAGVDEFGESRVQELRDKYKQLEEVEWHMVGHLQRNKVKYLARRPRCKLIHSLDSLRLAKKINDRGEKADRIINALVQINIAKDESKFGFYPEELEDFLHQVNNFKYLQIKGLMTLVPYVEDSEQVRPYFRQLRKMFVKFQEKQIPGIEMEELSMGMTNDFEVAIEEGATIIRVGRGIFGSRESE